MLKKRWSLSWSVVQGDSEETGSRRASLSMSSTTANEGPVVIASYNNHEEIA